MTLKVYTVYDSKVGAYLNPFFMKSNGECLRAWHEVCNDPQSNISKYPSDFTLFEIGEWDDSTGEFSMYTAKQPLGTALEYNLPEVLKPETPAHVHAVV